MEGDWLIVIMMPVHDFMTLYDWMDGLYHGVGNVDTSRMSANHVEVSECIPRIRSDKTKQNKIERLINSIAAMHGIM